VQVGGAIVAVLLLARTGRGWPQLERILLVGLCVFFAGVVAWDVGVLVHLQAAAY
jgi:hypothetical protein